MYLTKANSKKMRKILILIIIMTATYASNAQRISSEIKEIIVYQQQALINREVKTTVNEGYQQLVLIGIPNNVNKSTIQIQGKGNFTILGIKHQQNYLSEDTYPDELKRLQDHLEEAGEKLSSIRNQLKILKAEEDMLNKNQSIGGTESTLTVAQLESMTNFMVKRLTNLENKRIDLIKQENKQNELIVKLKKAFNDRKAFYQQHSSEVLVDIDASVTSRAVFEIEYVARNAGWYPEYDARAESETEKLAIAYKANVYQTTGEEWKGVDLTLSTGNPSISNTKPILHPHYINIYEPQPVMMKRKALRSNARTESMDVGFAEEELDFSEAPMEIQSSVEDFVSIDESGVSTIYAIDQKYTIPSDGKPISIEIQSTNPTANFEYAAVPKRNKSAYLIAKVKEWDSYDMLSGKMNIYLDGAYVGDSYLQTNTTEEEIVISLGRDERVIVKRERLKDYSSKNFIGSKRKETYGYSIEIKNTKKKSIKVTVEDQVPVSQNSEVVVKVTNTGEATYNEQQGSLNWVYNLNAGETKKASFGYELNYPKGKQITGH